MAVIRSLSPEDFPVWLKLWNGNNGGVENEAITTNTWMRLIDTQSPVHGLIIEDKGAPAGLVHYVLHPVTGSLQPVCYMQDLYVEPAHRRHGLARAMVKELARLCTQEQWARLYWLAEQTNEAAQNLYKTLGVKLDFTLHVVLPQQ